MKPEAMTVGSLVHQGLAAYYQGARIPQVGGAAITAAWAELPDETLGQRLLERATLLYTTYIEQRGSIYQPLLVEQKMEWEGIDAVVDMVATASGFLYVVEFKTSARPSVLAYDHSGQADLYAYLYYMEVEKQVDLIIYEVISDEGLWQHARPPDFDKAIYLVDAIKDLVDQDQDQALDLSHYLFDCPRCDFFEPCKLMDTGANWEAYCQQNYYKREEKTNGEDVGSQD